MQHNQHKRLAKKIVPRLDPTLSGQLVDSTTVAVLPPVFTTTEASPQPTTTTEQQQLPTTSLSLALPTSILQVTQTQVQAQSTTSSTQASQTSTSQAPVVTESTTSTILPTSSIESTTSTSTTPLTTSAAPIATSISSTPVQPTTAAAAPTTTTTKAAHAAATSPSHTSSLIRTSSLYTDSSGVIVNTVIIIPAPSPTTTDTSTTDTPKSTGNAGTIIGAVAGGFVAIICLIAFISWIVRQHNKRSRGNHDDFDKQSYLRNSMMIPDEPDFDRPVRGTQAALALARSNTNVGPRPPTMIERKNTYFTHGQPSPSFAPGQVISFEPGQIISAPGTATGEPAYPSPVAFAAYTPPDQYHQTELVRRPSGAQLLNRAPTNGRMYDNASYPHSPSPVSYGPESYHMQSPDSYTHDGYTYPMNPGAIDHRGMVQSVTPYQAQQYAEITRQLEGTDSGYEHDSFHPISPGPGPASPIGPATSGSPIKESPLDETPLPNPFDEPNWRIDSTPPALPPIENFSRTGTPIDPNPQHAHWSYDGKSQNGGNRLSVAGMVMPEPPTPPPMAVIHEDHLVPMPAPAATPVNVAAQPVKRPVSMFDADDAYGGM